MARHGIPCRGPEPAGLAIWADPAALASWTLANFDSYWKPLLSRARGWRDPWSLTAFTSYGAVWIVTGGCRLHDTLATGAIVSKEEAGCYGLRTLPERWHPVLNEGLRIRRADRARADVTSVVREMIRELAPRQAQGSRSLYRSLLEKRHDVLAFADMVIADARRRFAA